MANQIFGNWPTTEELARRYPWFGTRGLSMVLGDDLDSIASAILMHHTLGWVPVGFYVDYSKVWFLEDITESDLIQSVWLDLDISRREIRSIGHHILAPGASDLPPVHVDSMNPNLLRAVTAKSGGGRAGEHGAGCACGGRTFPHKYPLGTFHFLLWALSSSMRPSTNAAKALLWLPDSSWINGQSHRYRNNVTDWVTNWISHPLLTSTLTLIDQEFFEAILRGEVFPALARIGFQRGSGQSTSRHLHLGGYQCQFKDPNQQLGMIQSLADLVADTFGLARMVLKRGPYRAIEGRRNPDRLTLSELRRKYGSLTEFVSRERVFSYVIPNGGQINYTVGLFH